MDKICNCKICFTVNAPDGKAYKHFYNHPSEEEYKEHLKTCKNYNL